MKVRLRNMGVRRAGIVFNSDGPVNIHGTEVYIHENGYVSSCARYNPSTGCWRTMMKSGKIREFEMLEIVS